LNPFLIFSSNNELTEYLDGIFNEKGTSHKVKDNFSLYYTSGKITLYYTN